MKIAPSPRIVSRTLAAIVALTLAAGTATAAGDVYYERAFVRAAQDKCRLFEPRLTQALEAATLQARGAALRAGRPASELAATAARATARAEATPCNDAELGRVKTRVRHAFAGWSRAARISRAWPSCRAPIVITTPRRLSPESVHRSARYSTTLMAWPPGR